MDYLVATLDSKTGQQREVDSFVDKLKFDDRLFIFECDNVEMEQSPLRTVPTHQPNIFTITLNDFPFKTRKLIAKLRFLINCKNNSKMNCKML